MRQRQRKRTQVIAEKEQHGLATTTYDEHTKVEINEGTRQGNDSTLPSNVKENEGCEQRDQTCITKTFESITDLGFVGANADLIFAGDDQKKKRIKNMKTKVRQGENTKLNGIHCQSPT